MQHDPTREQTGLVVRVTGGEVWVDVDGRLVPCLLRGRLRKDVSLQVAAGDRVRVTLAGSEGGNGSIEQVEERESSLSRFVERDGSERLIVANVETLFVVAALKTPPVHLEFLDRVLVSAARGGVRARVVANKIDLVDEDARGDLDRLRAVYEPAGYAVMPASASTGEGVDEIAAIVGSGVYAFVGESGVGKSSLLMRIDPGLDLKVRDVGGKTGRGRHTTTFSQLYRFKEGWLADTPGVQTFGFPGDDPVELADCFPEFADPAADCHFNPCTHSHEPKCGVKVAHENGDVADSRYQSYLHILEEVEARARRRQR